MRVKFLVDIKTCHVKLLSNLNMDCYMSNEIKQSGSAETEVKRKGRKDSTADLPMVDLQEACLFVQKIREKGVESETMPVVAKASDYSSPTSTGFYRRMVAARLFKMIEPQSARLTRLALDYLKPDSDDARKQALREAVRSIPDYQPLFEKYSGTKLNAQNIANGITRAKNLSDDCALICAKVFIESLRFARELDADYTLLTSSKSPPSDGTKASENTNGRQAAPITPVLSPNEGDLETYFLTLDASKKRRVIIQAPPSVTPSELKRIQDWLSFQLLVEDQGSIPSAQ